MKFPTGREFETRVECALETYFVAGRFATVWALRLRVADEFIAGGLHKEQLNLHAWELFRKPSPVGREDHRLDLS